MLVSPAKPTYPIWYCPEFPIADLSPGSIGGEAVHAARPALLEHIRLHGILYPIVVLNHRNPKEWGPNAIWVGNNRVWAAKQLGLQVIRALVTGACPHPSTEVKWEDINSYTSDGEFYIDRMGWLKLRGMTDFKKGEFPDVGRGQGLGAY